MISAKNFVFGPFLVLSLLFAVMLSACGGEVATSVTVPTTVAGITPASTAAVAVAVTTTTAITTPSVVSTSTSSSSSSSSSLSASQATATAAFRATRGAVVSATAGVVFFTQTARVASGVVDVGEKDVPVYSGATRVGSMSASLGSLTSVYYTSKDDYSKILGWAKTAFTEKGWTDVTFQEAPTGGSVSITAKKVGYELKGTIIGPSSLTYADFKDVLDAAKAGPTEVVLISVISLA